MPLQVAKKRVAAAGLQDIIECIYCDFCDAAQVAAKLPKNGTVDLVTMSYSLSMIPDKEGALKSAVKLLKPKGEGVLGVADFFYGGGRRASHGKGDKDGVTNILTRIYCEFTRLWFAQDHVILLKVTAQRNTSALLTRKKTPNACTYSTVPPLPVEDGTRAVVPK